MATMNKKASSNSALMDWLNDNPEARNMAVGFVKNLEEQQRSNDMAGAEIAKTQYGYLTGAGMGNINKLQPKSSLDRLIQGYTSGKMERQGDDRNKAMLDLIKQNKGSAPFSRPNETIQQAVTNQNPNYPVSITPEAQGLSQDIQAADAARKTLMGGSDNYVIQDATDGQLATALTDFGALSGLDRNPMSNEEKDRIAAEERAKALRERQTASPYGFAYKG